MYKLVPEAKHWSGIAGIPWRDLTDDEYDTYSGEYDKQFPGQPGSLSRWFKEYTDVKMPVSHKEV